MKIKIGYYPILVGLLLMSFSACQKVNFISAERYTVIPGIPNGVSTVRYELTLEIEEKTQFVKVKLDEDTEVLKFSVINKAKNIQGGNKTAYNEGKYSLQFDLPLSSTTAKTKNAKCSVIITQGEKTKEVICDITKKSDKRLR